MPGNHPPEAVQRHFIDGYEGYLKSAGEGSIQLLFADPMHLVHNTLPGACWQERGGTRTHSLSSNTGRRRLNILGAINAVTKRWSGFVTEENCDREAIKALLGTVRKDYPVCARLDTEYLPEVSRLINHKLQILV